MTDTTDSIRRQIAAAREKLISTDARNPLIHFRRPAKSLTITAPVGAALVAKLLTETPLSYRPLPPPQEETEGQAPSEPPAPLRANEVQTDALAEKMLRALTGIYRENTTLTGDQGTQVLYVAVGFLEWFEAADSKQARYAPLMLVPVNLSRRNVSSGYAMQYTGDDVMGNEPLALRLRQDFGVELPSLDPDVLDVEEYFTRVTAVVATQKRWRVRRDAAHLGFFSFSRYLMARDLDADAWPQGQGPDGHVVVQALLGRQGFTHGSSGLADGVRLDDVVRPSSTVHIVDADSSQALAIHEVSQGQHLLIQGPPGTGKSQTITNIIADAVSRGRTVLFVAEKMAALEVVKRRLAQYGLGSAVLELHGHQTTRKSFIEQLRATNDVVTGGRRIPVDTNSQDGSGRALDRSAQVLNAYVDALHVPLNAFAVTPYWALGEWAKLDGLQGPLLSLPDAITWRIEDLRERERHAELLQDWVSHFGAPERHLFWGMTATTVSPLDMQRVQSDLDAAVIALTRADALMHELNVALGRDLGTTFTDVSTSVDVVLHLADAPDLRAVAVDRSVWEDQGNDLEEGLRRATQLAEVRARQEGLVLPEAWTTPVGAWRRDFSAAADKWWRPLSGTYRTARRGALGLLRQKGKPDDGVLLSLLTDLDEAAIDQQALDRLHPVMTSAFGERWQAERSHTGSLREVLAWVQRWREQVRVSGWPSWAVTEAAKLSPSVQRAQDTARQARGQLDLAEQYLRSAGQSLQFDFMLASAPLAQIAERSQSLRAALASAQEMATFNRYAQQARTLGLGSLVPVTSAWTDAGSNLVHLLRRTWLDGVIRAAQHERPALATFDAKQHSQAVRRFVELDQARLQVNRQVVAEAHIRRVDRTQHRSAWRVLMHQFNLKQRFKAIRALMTEAGPAVQQLKPVFMMSPLSVAHHLPRGDIFFDLVIFDEASQVRPEDGLGAITRGQQIVVVGDEKQMPPSNFFVGQDGSSADDTQDDDLVADLESLLGTFQSANAPQTMLRWHYRSRHESLIAVSNHEFYENKLVLFPSPDARRTRLGLIYHHLPHAHYDAGASRTNRVEARAVAKAVMQHARSHPNESLGVAAFSAAQADAILDALEVERRTDPSLETFFTQGKEEPFFVKNLENVQGDERDVIFISVGYGRQASGKLSMNFGPLNKSGGQRRMNVLITRAKLRCEVFTNLRSDELDLSLTQSDGVRVLKTFLQYAATGQLDVPTEVQGVEADSPFEEAVETALRARGHQVRRQVGSGGFKIDLAIVDPDAPGRYVLGIECDGATYHRSRSARDRDRLRQQVLENLGWRIHRIWSTDWFGQPARCLDELDAAIAVARRTVLDEGAAERDDHASSS